MKHVLRAVVLALLLAVPAAAGSVDVTFNAPVDQVWDKTMAVLKVLGWDGDNFGVYEKALRHRRQLNVRKASDTRTTVSVDCSVFKKAILDAIGKAL